MGAEYDSDNSVSELTGQADSPPPPPINLKLQTDAALAEQKAQAKANGLEAEEPVKKKKKKSKRKKKNTQPTGFEEYYVEAPLTPEQAGELNKLYSLNKPFAERMELCIQRYRAKRRWDPLRVKIFDRYLVLGGVRAGQKAYGGGLSLEARGEEEEPDADDIAGQVATDFIEHYPTSLRHTNNWDGKPGVFDDDDEEWWVDFELVVKAFLSHIVQQVFCLHTEPDILLAVKTIRNFLNYIIFHNVAPEYSSNILAAISICNLAEKELLFCNAALKRLPGRFNTCCSALFGGHYYNLYETDQASTWEGKHPSKNRILGVPKDVAAKYYEECIAKIGTEEQKSTTVDHVTLVGRDVIGFEVVGVDMPSGGSGGVKELGTLDVKPWVYEGERMPKHGLPEEGWKLWVEKEVGIYMYVGMKMEAAVYTLSNGLRYIDTTTAISPSYYTYLDPPNQNDTVDNDDGDANDDDTDD